MTKSDSLHMESLPIFDILNECRTVMKPRAQMKSIHLHLESNERISLYANRARLKQVLINLLFNAIQYTPAGGKVTIKWEKISPRQGSGDKRNDKKRKPL